MRVFIGILCLCYLIWHSAEAACANGCSGHGTCGQSNVCTCFTGWDGGAADCSYRVCPTGPAWADKPYATDSAHLPALCSNAGLCNRQSGQCECFKGFTGSACQRSVCPNSCSGHGTCVSIGDVSYYYGADYNQLHRLDTDAWASGDGKGVVYTNWDKDSITMCECDPSYFGPDCSLHMCAKGDDPLTINQNYRQMKFSVKVDSGSIAGDVGISFQGTTTYVDLDAPSGAMCKNAVEASPHFGTVGCFYTAVSGQEASFDFVFYSWPLMSRGNNLFSHDGNPVLSSFHCDVSLLIGDNPQCLFEDVQVDNVREWNYCSNRGNCDFSSGLCSCNAGYGGAACSNSTLFAGISGSNAAPGMQILVDGADYTGDALQIRSSKSSASDFYLIEAIANNERMFFVRGDGAVGFTSFITPGGATIGAGGLKVESGGVTIGAGGLEVQNGGINIDNGNSVLSSKIQSGQSNVLSVTADTTDANLPGSFAVLDIKTNSPSANHHLLTTKDNTGAKIFTVKNDGLVQVHQGGLYVDGGISVNSGGLEMYGGLSVESGGLTVRKMGLTVTEGSIVAQQGIQVKTQGLQVDTGGVKIMTAGMDIISGGMRVHSGIAQIKAGMYVTGGLTVMAGGLRATGGITIHNNGLTIQNGGLLVTGGVTISDVGLTLSGTTFTSGTNIAYTDSGTEYLLTTSDRRLKERIEALEMHESLDKLSKLKGIYYYWTKQAQERQGYDHRRHFGFLAQDVQDVLPEAVSSIFGEKYLAIDYPSIVPLVTAGVNDLADITAQVKAELVTIQSRLDELEEAERRRLSVSSTATEREKSLERRLAALQARVDLLEKL